MNPTCKSPKTLEIFACEIEGGVGLGSNVAEYRGRFYRLLGETNVGKPIMGFDLVADCERVDEGIGPVMRIVSEPRRFERTER